MSVIEERRQSILQAFATPATVDEVAKKLGTSYITVWRAMQPVIEDGLLKEVPWKVGRTKQWVTIGRASETGTVVITTPTGTLPVGEWTTVTHRQNFLNNILDVSGALSQAYRYQAFRGTQDEHLAGSMTPTECKAELRKVLEFTRRLSLAIEQMLIADIWENTKECAERFGPVDVRAVIQVGEAFEKRHGK